MVFLTHFNRSPVNVYHQTHSTPYQICTGPRLTSGIWGRWYNYGVPQITYKSLYILHSRVTTVNVIVLASWQINSLLSNRLSVLTLAIVPPVVSTPSKQGGVQLFISLYPNWICLLDLDPPRNKGGYNCLRGVQLQKLVLIRLPVPLSEFFCSR